MKRQLIVSILAMAATASFAQGFIVLDNYDSNGPLITYGFGCPANGVSGAYGTPGAGLNGSWTVGIYFVVGTPTIFDPAGSGFPILALSLGSGPGSTAQMDTYTGMAGEFLASAAFDTGAAAGDWITAEIVVYPTAAGSYANAFFRAHSAPFTMPTASATSLYIPMVVDYMGPFSITLVPEPTTLALVGLGFFGLWTLRRK